MIPKRPYLILIRGLPGSGKSFITNALQQKIGIAECVVLDPDATDYSSQDYVTMSEKLSSESVDSKFHPYRFLRNQAYNGIEASKVIIWNQAFTNLDGFQKTVTNLVNYAAEYNVKLPVLVVEVEIDPGLAKQRIAERVKNGQHDVPSEKFEQFVEDYHSFKGDGFQVLEVSGEDNTDLICEKILAIINQPE